jgi:SAM-dependent methyltransferase
MTTPDPHAQRYDEVPYPNLVHGRSHPRTTGAIAALFSLSPAPVESARVLDLGCAAGMNILAMAADLPRASFVGVDISQGQITTARMMATDLALENVSFLCASFSELGDLAPKSFDYIICHGVFSWVAPPLREVLLREICRLLADDGLAYISYNTYPGWHFGNIVRDLMVREMDPQAPPLERVRAARATLERHLAASEDRSLRRALLTAEHEHLIDHSDSYIFHEYLTPEHHPLWFKDFAALLPPHDLVYVADALPGLILPSTQDARLAHLIEPLTPDQQSDVIEQQHAIDEHLNNRFRRSILARSHHRPTLSLDPGRLARLHLRLPRDHILVSDSGSLAVRDRRGRLIPIQLEAAADALEELRRVSPASAPLSQLAHVDDPASRAVLGTLVGLVFAEAVEATLSPVSCASVLPARPEVTRLNRYQARRGDPIASRLFVSELVGELGLDLIQRLDGHLTIDELVADTGAQRDLVEQHLRTFVERGLLLPA